MSDWLCDRCGAANDFAVDFCARCGADGQIAKRTALHREAGPVTDATAQAIPQPGTASISAPRPVNLKAGETIEQAYLRQIRDAAVFIAWIVGIIFVANLIIGIIVANKLS